MTFRAPLAPDLQTIVHLSCCRWDFYFRSSTPCFLLGFFHHFTGSTSQWTFPLGFSLPLVSSCCFSEWQQIAFFMQAWTFSCWMDKSHICHQLWQTQQHATTVYSKASQDLTLLYKISGWKVGPQDQVGSQHSETGFQWKSQLQKSNATSIWNLHFKAGRQEKRSKQVSSGTAQLE